RLQLAAALERGADVVQQLGNIGAGRRFGVLIEAERTLVVGLGAGFVARIELQQAPIAEGLRNLDAVGSELCGAKRKRSVQQRAGLIEHSQAGIRAAHGVEKRGLDLAVHGLVGLNALGTAIEQLAGGDGATAGLIGLRDLKQVGEEGGFLVGAV